MPQVPIVEGRQVRDAPLQGGFQQAPDVGAPTRALSQGLDVAGDVMARVVDRQDQDVAWATDAKIKTDAAKFTSGLQQQMRGNAVNGAVDPKTSLSTGSYSQKVEQWWNDTAKTYAGALTPSQQNVVTRNLQMSKAAAVQSALQYENGERDKSWAESAQASLNATKELALQTGTKLAAQIAVTGIREQLFGIAKHKGILGADGKPDANWINEQTLKETTALHANMIGQLQQSDPAKAKEYFEEFKAKGEIAGTQLDNLQRSITTAQAAVDGLAGAHEAFNQFIPTGATPAMGSTPLDTVAMRSALEKKFGGNPVALAAANDSLNRIVADWKNSEAQYQTSYKAELLKGVNNGLAWMKQQPAWNKLDGATQAAVDEHQSNRAYSLLLRGNAIAARDDAAEARADRARGRANFDQFLTLQMDPEKVAQMKPQEVQNLMLTMSQQQVEHIAQMRAHLNNSADVRNAKIDVETFTTLATGPGGFGLKSLTDPSASKADKDYFSYVKQNVDFVLQKLQEAKKSPLTPSEKAAAMQEELARTVTVNPGWFSFNVNKPVVGLTAKDTSGVVVPEHSRGQPMKDSERGKIMEALRVMHDQDPGNPEYQITEANIRRRYLIGVSPAGRALNVK